MRYRYVRGQVLFGPTGRQGDGDTLRIVDPAVYDLDDQPVPFTFYRLSESTGSVPLRLLGVDTPEETYAGSPLPGHGMEHLHELGSRVPQQEPWAGQAKAFTDAFFQPGDTVTVALDRQMFDVNGRLLGYAHRGGLERVEACLNLALLREGWAALYQVDPNLQHTEDFAVAVMDAQAAQRGIWPAFEDHRALELREVQEHAALNPPFVYRKVIDATIAGVSVEQALRVAGRWVADRSSGVVHRPEHWWQVPHAQRVFFAHVDQAEAQGYRRAG